MSLARRNRAAKFIAYALVYLSLFIIPFLVFGKQIEEFAEVFLSGEAKDGIVTVIAALLLAGDPVLPTPSSVVATLLAARIGFFPAALVNGVALSAACLIGYALGRGGGKVLARAGWRMPDGFVLWVQQHGLVATLLCRPVPVLAEASLILAGAAGHEPRRLLAWCCTTQVILGAAYAFAGSGWGEGQWNNAAIFFGSVCIPVIAATIVFFSMRWRG